MRSFNIKKAGLVAASVAIIGGGAAALTLGRGGSEAGRALPMLYEASKDETERSGQELSIGVTDMVGLFNPAYAAARGDRIVSSLVFEPFMKKDSQGSYVPAAAESAELSEDGLSMTIVFPEGLSFSDGTAAGARDGAASVIAMASSEDEEISSIYENIAGIEVIDQGGNAFPDGLVVEDAYRLRLSFKNASPDNLRILETPLQKGSFMEAPSFKDALNAISRGGIGTGAYVLSESDEPSAYVELSANTGYREGAAAISDIEVVNTTYGDMAGLAYDIFIWEDSEQLLSAVMEAGSHDIYMKPTDRLFGLFFSEMNRDFEDPRLRLAMGEILREATGAGSDFSRDMLGRLVPTGSFDKYDIISEHGGSLMEGDPEIKASSKEAKELIEELRRGGENGTQAVSLSYRLPVIEDNELQMELADWLSELFSAYGIELLVEPKSISQYQADCIMGIGYDLLLSSVSMPETAEGLRTFYERPSSLTVPMTTESQLGALSAYEQAFGLAEAKLSRDSFFDTLSQEMPFVPIGRAAELIAVASDIEGGVLSADTELMDDMVGVSLK